MGIPTGVQRVVLSGTMPGGDIWQTGFWINHQASSPSDAATLAQAYWTILTTPGAPHLIDNLKAYWWSTQTSFTKVSVYSYNDSSGHATFVGQYQGTAVPGTRLTYQVNQCSVCVTTLTAFAGARHRGRMYFPATGAAVTSDGKLSNVDIGTLLTAVYTDMKACEVAAGGFLTGVMSPTLSSITDIQSLRADQRPDIQRRRANRQDRGSTTTKPFTRP